MSSPQQSNGRARSVFDESGSAVTSHVMVQALVVFLVISLLQLAFAFHLRAVAIDAAVQGARRIALYGGTEAEGEARVRQLIDSSVFTSFPVSSQVSITPGPRFPDRDSTLVEVKVAMPLPLIAMLGPAGMLEVRGRALRLEQKSGPR